MKKRISEIKHMDQGLQAFLIIAIPFSLIMASFIYFAAFRRLRVQVPSEGFFQLPYNSSFRLDCTRKAIAEFARKQKLIARLPIFIALTIYCGSMFSLIVSSEAPLKDFFDPQARMFKFAILISGLLGTGFIFGYLRIQPQLERRNKIYNLSKSRVLIFEGSAESLRIPTLLLTNPTFARAADKELYEIIIPLSEIKRIEVLPAMGNSPAGFKLILQGASKEWGQGFIGDHNVFQFGIGIRSGLFNSLELKAILSYFRDRFGERLEIRDPSIEKQMVKSLPTLK